MLTKKQFIEFTKHSKDDAEILIDGKPIKQVHQDGRILVNSVKQKYPNEKEV